MRDGGWGSAAVTRSARGRAGLAAERREVAAAVAARRGRVSPTPPPATAALWRMAPPLACAGFLDAMWRRSHGKARARRRGGPSFPRRTADSTSLSFLICTTTRLDVSTGP